MAEQQALISTEGGRVGLARSRSDVQGDQNASKKQKLDKNWVHKQTTEQNGQQICNHCRDTVSNSNVTRRKEHLLDCKSFLGSQEAERAAGSDLKLKEAVEKYRQEQLQQTQSVHQRQRSLVQSLLTGGVRGGPAGSRVDTAQGFSFVKKWPNMTADDIQAAQVAIALAFYAGNLPHSLIELPEFKAMILTLAPWMEGHVPTRKMLSGSLLDKVYGAEVERVRSWLEQQDYVATSTDAWSSSHSSSTHVLNVNAMANGTSVFLDMIFTGADSHTGEYIADKVHTVLSDWGIADKVVGFVTDWGSNMVSAGTELASKLTNFLTSVQCLQHLLNNALKDFAKEPSLGTLIEQSKKVVQFITGHTATKAIYDSKKKELKGTALVKAGTTRFGTNINSMQSCSKNEPVLRATVNSIEYHDFMQRQKKPSDKAQALEVKGVIADTSSTYFLDLKWSLDTLAPFVSAIREVEGDTAKLSDAYFAVQALSKHVRAVSNVQGSFTNLLLDDTTPLSTLTVSHSFSRAFLDAWQPRADQACNTVVMAAAMLDPRYKDKLSSMPADHQLRAEQFIVQQTKKLWGDAAGVRVQAQLMKYKVQPNSIGATAEAVQATVSQQVLPEEFWKSLEQLAPELSKVARMLLVIPPASATSERVYSAVGRVWDPSRSRLTNSRVRKLLFVYFNRKALLRDGDARNADDFAAFQEWLESIPEEQQQQQPVVIE